MRESCRKIECQNTLVALMFRTIPAQLSRLPDVRVRSSGSGNKARLNDQVASKHPRRPNLQDFIGEYEDSGDESDK